MSEASNPAVGSQTADVTAPLVAEGLCRRFSDGDVTVLDGASLSVAPGERLAIVGRSGSGKSTLLHLLAGLDDPDEGRVLVAGHDMTAARPAERARIRNRHMGFVYQFHHLLPEFSAVENVAMPLLLGGVDMAAARERASTLLARIGLSARLEHRPHQLSGGERQRVAVARAVAPKPDLVLADEPTGSLDHENAAHVAALIDELCRDLGTAFVVVTHDRDIADRTDRMLVLEQGRLRAP